VYCTLCCTFTVYFLSLSLVRTKVSGSEVLAWVRGQRKTSQVLGAFGLLDFTMLRPVLAWRTFWDLWAVYFFNFQIFSGRGKPRILNQWIRGHDCKCACCTTVGHENSVAEINLLYDVFKGGCSCVVLRKFVILEMNFKETTNHIGDVEYNVS
jgi:hypothetical protein